MKAQTLSAKTAGLLPVLLGGLLLLGSPASSRAQGLEALELSGALVADGMGVVSGGLERAWAGLYNVDLQATLEGETLGWSGGRAFLYVLGNGGDDPTDLIGDFQVVNNIAAPATWKIFEAWIEQAFRDDAASVRAGLYDLNSEFDVVESSEILLNSSFGIGPDFSQSGLNGPSIFPTTSLALRVEARLGERLLLRGAVLDGVPGDPDEPRGTRVILDGDDGLLFAGEAEWSLARGRAAVGGWGYSRDFDTNRARLGISGSASDEGPSFGGYALAETRLVSEADPAQGLNGFLRAGWASGQVHQVGSYLGGGGSYTGLLPGRDDDELALGVAAARNSDEFMAARADAGSPTDRWEVAIEATYLAKATDWLTVQPDLQLVLNPGTDPAVSDAVVVGLRVILAR